jgi:hypothetical protein
LWSIFNEPSAWKPDLSDPAARFAVALAEERASFTRAFVEQGRDPRELKLDLWDADGHPSREITLEEARKESRFVVMGRVDSTTYVADLEDLGHPRSIATVEVERVVKGRIKSRTIEVAQSGGPFYDFTGGSLYQYSTDPLLLPGDHVILLLVPARRDEDRDSGRYSAVLKVGVYLVTPQGVYANGRNDLAGVISGRSPEEVLALFK